MNTVHGPYGPQDFPRLAKEMGFCFTLRRGRVDWYRIDSIDVDRLVQDRDLVALQENLLSIVNYNLDSEFDVKILDTNFVKLFRLAQLAIDYLMYSEQYLYNCIQAEHEEKNKLIKDLEKLKKESKKKDCEIKNLKRRQYRLQLDGNHLHKYALGAGGEVPNYYKCLHCGKLFLTPGYLEAHHGRRHPGLTFAVNHSRTSSPDVLRTETERLQSEIKELKERLNSTERLLHTADSSPVFQDHGTFVPQSDIQAESVGQIDEARKEMEELQKAQHRKYLEEISALKTMFTNELKRLRQQNQQESNNNLQEQIQKQEQEILLLREKLSVQSTPDLDSIQSKMDAQERLWKSKLKQVELEHRNEVEQLKAQLRKAKESYKTRQPVIEKPEPVKVSVGTNTETIEVAAPPKPSPVTAITEEPELQAQEGNIVNIGDSSITLAELTARIESAIRASQGGSTDAGKEKEKKESPQIFRIPEGRLTVQTFSEKPPVRLKKSLSDPSTRSKPVKIRKNSQPVKSSVAKSLFTDAQLPKNVIKLTSESSDESSRTEQQGTGFSADELQQAVQAGSASKVVKAWSSAQSLDKESDNLVASKDSGLDSPKRIPSGKVTKIESSEKGSLKSTNALKESKDVHRHEKSETEEDEDEEEGEEEEEEEEVEEEEEETEENEQEEEDETSTDHETVDALAARNIESLEDTLKQNPQILEVLKEDLQELLARRLREFGIDPEWKGIPTATFQQKKVTLRHHQKITAKGYKSYFKIRKKLLRDVQTKLAEKETGAQDSSKQLKQDKRSRWNSSQQRRTVRNLVGKVKSKALSVLKGSRSNEALQAKSGSSSKLDTRTSTKSPSGVRPKSSSTPSKTLPSHLEKRRKHIHAAKQIDGKTLQVFSKPKMAEPKMRMYPSSQRNVTTASKAKIVTSTPHKDKNTIVIKGRDRAAEEMHAASVSSLDEEEEEEEEAEGTNKDQYSSDEAEKNVAGSSINDLHLSQDQENKNNPTKTSLQVTAIRTQEVPSSQLTPPLKSRSALKTASSASLGSLTKKRVLFVGQDNDSSDREHSDIQETKTTLATARHAKSIDSIVPRPTTSWDSNASAVPTKPLKFTSEPLVSQKLHVQSDSDSEWSIDIDTIKRPLDAPSSEKIQLSTKQSPLIAQLSKDIQKQLSARSGAPPAGSVETMLTASSLLHGSSEQSLFSDIENDMNLRNKPSSSSTTPKSKPRSNVPSSPSKLSTSDWDLEDLDD